MSEEERALLLKYKEGLCTEAESAAVEKWLFELHDEPIDLSAETIANIKAEVRSQLPDQIITQKHRIYKYWPGIAAAISMAVFGAGLFYFFQAADLDNQQSLAGKAQSQDIAPGIRSATLTLADGKKIVLSDALNGELTKEAGVRISKTADGLLIYNVIPSAELALGTNGATANSPAEEITYNTLTTAKGETFQVRLPDGTLVVLNAASSLTYATTLNTQPERKVKLEGEAYFEVAKIKQKRQAGVSKPFVVMTAQQEVEVLGTHFNINSYADEPVTKTTLVEGLVSVSNGTVKELLQPGEQAIAKKGGFSIKEVNIQQAVAWKNGTFDFDNEDISSVMRKISRWYNVAVEFQGEISKERFNGALSSKKNLSQMLKMLESTGVVHFKTEGRRIIVINN